MRLVAVVGLNRGLGPISITLQGQVQPSELTLNKVGYEEKKSSTNSGNDNANFTSSSKHIQVLNAQSSCLSCAPSFTALKHSFISISSNRA